MRTYLVHLTVFVGEYEKVYEKVVTAADEEHAQYDTLYGETHNTEDVPTFSEWQTRSTNWQWEDDYMIYAVRVIKELDPNQINAIKGIFTLH